MKAMAFALLTLLVSSPQAPPAQPAKPRAVPFFEAGAPAFVVACANTSTSEIRPGGSVLVRTWLDGKPTDSYSSSRAAIVIPPGEVWREVVRLSRDLAPGPHAVAFECGGAKSDDVQFVWQFFAGSN